jgi:hypothetical protein
MATSRAASDSLGFGPRRCGKSGTTVADARASWA